jgi:formylglycine-generating enzyme required for sulfatase activity
MADTTVFLSSTAKDLQPWRDAVSKAIAEMEGHKRVGMEDFGARDGTPESVCREEVAAADVFVGLIGLLHGSRPPGSELSYTEVEYDEATKRKKTQLLFVTQDDFPLPGNLREPDEAWQRQQRFRERVLKSHTAKMFREPHEVAAQVVAALQKHQVKSARQVKGKPEAKRKDEARKSPDLAATEKLYLELLAERFRYLDFRGMGVSDRVPLKLPLLEMYVPLQARVQSPEGETWARDLRLAGRIVTEEEVEGVGERLSEPQPVLELLSRRKSGGLILLGDPGSGKTTFLKFLALKLAQGVGKSLKLGARLPILLPLSAYANALARAKKDLPLLSYLSRYFEEERGFDLPLAPLFEKKIAQGKVVLLLDGLDEVREVKVRKRVVDAVQDFCGRHRKAGNRFVMTSRVVGYREVRPAAEGLSEATLVDFEDEEIESFVERWTAALEKAASGEGRAAQEDAGREREALLTAVRANPGVRSLAANPLLLTVLALMKRQGVTLPERRVELYQRYVETLLKHWNLARGLPSAGRPARDLDLVETLKILQPLALWMHESSPGVGLVKEGDLHRELERIYGSRGEKKPERAAHRFLEDVREHASLLLDRGGRQYGFIHLTLEEYLAAAALAQRGQQDVGPVIEALAAHVGEDPWHEVSLLTVGYLGLVQQRDEAAGAVLEELLRRSPGPAGEAVILAGEAVADMGSGGVPAGCREAVVAALLKTMRDDEHVEARRRAAAGAALAAVGDPRPEVMTVDGMEFCWVPAGPFWMGELEENPEAYDDEKPRHECLVQYGFWIGRYPVTTVQFREFVEESGFLPGRAESLQERSNGPATISWYEALAFCEWLTKRWRKVGRLTKGWSVQLPSEAEWEKTARGGLEVPERPVVGPAGSQLPDVAVRANSEAGRAYPWGEEVNPDRVDYGIFSLLTHSVLGCFPGGASPYGCEELNGYVQEWTRSLWGEDLEKPRFGYPYEPGDGREDMQAPAKVLRVVRGGEHYLYRGQVRSTFRFHGPPDYGWDKIGFRVVLSPVRPGL